MDYEAFFAANYGKVVRALTFALRDRDAAEDAAQEAFAKAYRKWSTVSVHGEPSAWIYVVAVRDARRRLGRLDRIERRALDAAAARPLAQTQPGPGDVDELTELLEALAPRQRMAVVLRYWGDLDEASIAEAMGCARGTVKATLSQALSRLRVQVQQEVLNAN